MAKGDPRGGLAMQAWPSWDCTKTFRFASVRRRPRWEPIVQWVRFARAAADAAEREVHALLSSSAAMLAGLGGDPSGPDAPDWSRFRPLRLTREEDWSDWLAHLLETSPTGTFAGLLFRGSGNKAQSFAHPRAEREVVAGSRRADLVVHWQDGAMAHVEVKVGDQDFDKTFETARNIESANRDMRIVNYILLPPWSRPAWERCAAGHASENIDVQAFDWMDVVIALRRALPEQILPWSVWAWSFCGCIERLLLSVGSQHVPATAPGRLEAAIRFRHILLGARDA
jgi:hypothetical protein